MQDIKITLIEYECTREHLVFAIGCLTTRIGARACQYDSSIGPLMERRSIYYDQLFDVEYAIRMLREYINQTSSISSPQTCR